MSNENPGLTFTQAIQTLATHREEWAMVLKFLNEERETFILEQRQAETSNDVMKLAGSIATLAELKGAFTPDHFQP